MLPPRREEDFDVYRCRKTFLVEAKKAGTRTGREIESLAAFRKTGPRISRIYKIGNKQKWRVLWGRKPAWQGGIQVLELATCTAERSS